MYFLLVLKKKHSIDVNSLFKTDVQNIPTQRFNKYFSDGNMTLIPKNTSTKSDKKVKFKTVKKGIAFSDRLYPRDCYSDDELLTVTDRINLNSSDKGKR